MEYFAVALRDLLISITVFYKSYDAKAHSQQVVGCKYSSTILRRASNRKGKTGREVKAARLYDLYLKRERGCQTLVSEELWCRAICFIVYFVF